MNAPVSTRPLHQISGLAAWLAVAFAAGAIGSIASVSAREFNRGLVRPAWAPPGWIFGPVWSTLYVMMGVAAWLVWRERRRTAVGVALALFVAQLALNSLWSWLFFVWREGAWAFAEILILWLVIAATLAAFWRIHRVAAVLLVPYLAWVTFAAALCFSVWQSNPAQLGG